ncbi:B-cell lymphoma 3 protein-like isoform X2 [Polyodon spathula]|uniref:B-cell lymphoma 3 protein-like isoform X2 n=1 Tax=Polyodon spathula TaxID=7913 RepID=UPI001B7E39D7|nr:B-cell lymphoma 3 protein-like isoform X2 [Polyodon spathula]
MDGDPAPVIPLDLRTTRKSGSPREDIATTDKPSTKQASRLGTSASTGELGRTGRMGCKGEAAEQRQDWDTESRVQGPWFNTVPPRAPFAQVPPGYQALVPSYSAQNYPFPVAFGVDSVWRPPLVHISSGSGFSGVYLPFKQQREHGHWKNEAWRGQTAAVSPVTTQTPNATSRTPDSLERPQSGASSSPVCKTELQPNSHGGSKATDKPALSLPLRKRPYPAVETEDSRSGGPSPSAPCKKEPNSSPPAQEPETGGTPTKQERRQAVDARSPADSRVMQGSQAHGFPERKAVIDGMYSRMPAPGGGARSPYCPVPGPYPQAGYPYCPVPAPHLYLGGVISMQAPPFPVIYPMEDKLASDIAMATRQDEDGDTALHIAVVQGQELMVLALTHILQQGKRDLDTYNNLRQTPLHLAVITHQPQMVSHLVGQGASAMLLDRNGQTSIHLACEHSQQDCLQEILVRSQNKLDLEARNYQGFTPLHIAVNNNRKDLLTTLLSRGADIDAVDIKSGRSPLIHAVENNSLEMVNFLIEHGANVNAQSYSGNTALHSASGRGLLDIARVLLKNGADCGIKNYHNDTALMVAKNKRVIDALRGKGSRVAAIPKLPEITTELLPSPHGSRSSSSSPTHTHNGNSIPSPGPALRCSPLAASPAQQQHHLPAPPPSSSPLLAPPQRPASQSNDGQWLSPGRDERHVQCQSYQAGGALSPAALPNFHSFSNGPPFSPGVLYAKQGDYRNLPQGYYLEGRCIPHPTAFLQPYLLPSPARASNHPLAGISLDQSQPSFDSQSPAPLNARPSSRNSDQSDVSTMSVSSGGKGES